MSRSGTHAPPPPTHHPHLLAHALGAKKGGGAALKFQAEETAWLASSGVPLTQDSHKYEQAPVPTKLLAILRCQRGVGWVGWVGASVCCPRSTLRAMRSLTLTLPPPPPLPRAASLGLCRAPPRRARAPRGWCWEPPPFMQSRGGRWPTRARWRRRAAAFTCRTRRWGGRGGAWACGGVGECVVWGAGCGCGVQRGRPPHPLAHARARSHAPSAPPPTPLQVAAGYVLHVGQPSGELKVGDDVTAK